MINAKKNYCMQHYERLSILTISLTITTQESCFKMHKFIFVIVKNVHINCFKAKEHKNQRK